MWEGSCSALRLRGGVGGGAGSVAQVGGGPGEQPLPPPGAGSAAGLATRTARGRFRVKAAPGVGRGRPRGRPEWRPRSWWCSWAAACRPSSGSLRRRVSGCGWGGGEEGPRHLGLPDLFLKRGIEAGEGSWVGEESSNEARLPCPPLRLCPAAFPLPLSAWLGLGGWMQVSLTLKPAALG